MYQTSDNLLLCQMCNGQITEPKSLTCRHTFCKSCLLEVLNTSLITYHGSSSLACPICKQQMPDVTTPDDIENLTCDFFELNLINALADVNKEEETGIFGEKNLDFVKYNKTQAQLINSATTNCSNEKQDNLAESSMITKCATHPDLSVTFCCLDCPLLLCDQCAKDRSYPNINLHSAHRVLDIKTTWYFIRNGIQYCNTMLEKKLKEYTKKKEQRCNEIKAKERFNLLTHTMTQQLAQIDYTLNYAFEADGLLLHVLKRKCNEMMQNFFSNSLPFNHEDFYSFLNVRHSTVYNLFQLLRNATETVSEMQQFKMQFLNKRSFLSYEAIEVRLISDKIRSFIEQVSEERKIGNVRMQTIKTISVKKCNENSIKSITKKAPKVMKANFCHRLHGVNLKSIFSDDSDGFSIFDNATFSVYNFDSFSSLTSKIPFQIISRINLCAYSISNSYVVVVNSQRNRIVYFQDSSWCPTVISPLINADQWAVYPTEILFPGKGQSNYKIKCAHAYITLDVTNRCVCLKFCANDQLKTLILVQQFKMTTCRNNATKVGQRTLMTDSIQKNDLLLTANTTSSLFAVAYLVHILVLDSSGKICYQFDSSNAPDAMSFNWNEKLILAALITEKNVYKFEVTMSTNTSDQAVLTYDIGQANMIYKYGILMSIASNNDDILFLATNIGYIWALCMK